MNSVHEVEYRVVEKLDEQGRLLRRIWHASRTAASHRVGGPAVEIFEPNSGKLVGEIWLNQFRNGRHRDGNLPSEVAIDPESGIIVLQEFYRDNRHHRDDGDPTEIYRNGVTGHITMLVFSYEGWRDREGDLAAVQEFSETDGRLIREEFYQLGQLHRESGPAIVDYDTSGTPITSSLQYYRKGNRITVPGGFTPPGP